MLSAGWRAAPLRALPHQAPDLRPPVYPHLTGGLSGAALGGGPARQASFTPRPCGPLLFLPRQAAVVRAFLGMLPLWLPLCASAHPLKPTHQSSSHRCCQGRTTWDRAELQSKIPGPWDRKRRGREA